MPKGIFYEITYMRVYVPNHRFLASSYRVLDSRVILPPSPQNEPPKKLIQIAIKGRHVFINTRNTNFYVALSLRQSQSKLKIWLELLLWTDEVDN